MLYLESTAQFVRSEFLKEMFTKNTILWMRSQVSAFRNNLLSPSKQQNMAASISSETYAPF